MGCGYKKSYSVTDTIVCVDSILVNVGAIWSESDVVLWTDAVDHRCPMNMMMWGK